MAVTTTPFLNDVLQLAFVVDATADITLEQNVRGGPTTLHWAFIDNSANASTEYFKIWNSKSVVVGTDDPDFEFLIPASVRIVIGFGPAGELLSNGLTFGVSDAAGTATGGAPGSAVIVRLVCT